VNSAFNGKRKMLRKSLQHLCSSSEIEAALHKIGSSDLMLDDFVRLHSHLVEVLLYAVPSKCLGNCLLAW